MDKDVIQGVAAAKRSLEFFGGAKRSDFAPVHDRHAIAMALRLFQIMCGEEQCRTVAGPQIDQMSPNRVARNRVQPYGWLVEEEHPRPMQCRLSDFQPPHHAAGVLVYQPAAVGSQTHELQGLADTPLLLAVWQVVKFGENEQVLVTRE